MTILKGMNFILLLLNIFDVIVLTYPIDDSNLVERKSAFPPGEACVFNAPKNAKRQGHMAWGFQYNASTYVYGSDNGKIPKSKKKDWLQFEGNHSTMLKFFKDYKFPKNYRYEYYNCEKVENPDPSSAINQTLISKEQDYHLLGCNCLDDTIAILTAYNAPGVPPVNGKLISPNWWFDHLAKDGNPNG
ncbi:15868_t:CDS:1, partial [Cetraspora pellucida]